ncbi:MULTISPECIES: non-ribosomal peptide synthetase [unclassified Crossiella]|uniref:non-ribosomal peptide synthetase n=1 Tax=unclassified Crossiella TaxID=2620835 RepID=UPI001FFFA77C|nr:MULTISPECIES: non-ribosomal peptide synthetase [unclassified Crossiella]MCK2245073.1 amino acid adenylation domain-containing protein [Crossiella sp. S99.2]MCK2258654.1 amino acid adenylation domain-containing protein [Crossiella sp. S99.1]
MTNEPGARDDAAAAKRRALMRQLMAKAGIAEDVAPDRIKPRDRSARTPLSFAQQSMWVHQQSRPDSAAYNVAMLIRLSGELDEAALGRALGELVRNQEILRTRYLAEADGSAHQVVAEESSFTLSAHELTGSADLEAAADAAAAEFAAAPFDLSAEDSLRAVLLRLGAREHALVLVVHHIACDGLTWHGLFGELAARYRAAQVPAPAVQYADFAAWQRTTWQAPEADLTFWRERLTPTPEPLDLPTDHPRPAQQAEAGHLIVRRFDSALPQRLREFAARENVTPFMVLLAATSALLHRYTGATDLALGTVATSREQAELAHLVGNFGNTLVLRTDLAGEPDFRELLDRVRTGTREAFAHQSLPFDSLLDAVRPRRAPGHAPLFDVVLAFIAGEILTLDLPGVRASWRHVDNGTTQTDLGLQAILTEDTLLFEATYRTELFTADRITRLLGHLEHLLTAALSTPDTPISRLDLLGPEERTALVEGFNNTAAGADWRSVAEQFLDQAERTPEATALVFGADRLSYRQLAERAERLAARLAARGAGPERTIALALPRSAELVVALLAIVRSGAAYLPIDLAYPAERITLMLTDAAPHLVLCEPGFAATAGLPPEQVFSLADNGSSEPPRRPSAEHPAYVIFTSGSTGRPKAVQGTQLALANRLAWGRALTQDRVRVAKSPLSFIDGSTELLGALVAGATVVLADAATAADPARLVQLVDEQRIELVTVVPSLLATLLDIAPPGALDSVRTWITSGEALPAALADAVAARWPQARVVNLYGCSEAAGDSLAQTHRPGATGPVPIGTPVANTQAYVLDHGFQPSPLGVPGELYLAGHGLARGYLGAPARTAERFLPNPFGPPGSRLYRTGDLVRRRADGVLEFLGRADQQIKIRGFRVEPGEIEAVLRVESTVDDAVVVAREIGGETRLVGYVVGSTEGLRDRLADHLPSHLVPAVLVELPAIPLSPSGKLDRAALPAPEAASAGGEARDDRERLLCGLFAELLGVPAVGIEDDFFALGGHSLLATRLVSRVRAELGAELTLKQVFEARSVRSLAALVATTGSGRPAVREIARTEPVPASFAALGMWFEERLHGPSATYTISRGIRLRGPVDLDALTGSLTDLLRRHETLRTLLVEGPEGLPQQRILPAEEALAHWRPTQVDARDWPEAELRSQLEQDAARPFLVATELPVRATLFRTAAEEVVLLVLLHHTAADDWSFGPLFAELAHGYQARTTGSRPDLPPLPVQYADYTGWHRAVLGDRTEPGTPAAAQLDYWERQLAGSPAELTLPTSRPRPAVASHRGNLLDFRLPHEMLLAARELAGRTGGSVFMVLHAAVAALLHKLGAGTDIPLGVPIAGRTDPDLHGLIGMFANTLVLRTDLGGDPSFTELLARVRETDLAAYEHADVPFDWVVERLRPERSLARSPLFQVMLVPRQDGGDPLRLPGVAAEPFLPATGSVKFDMSVHLGETEQDGVHGTIVYSTDLFDHELVTELAERLRLLLRQVLAGPDQRLSTVDILLPAERAGLDQGWNDTAREIPAGTLVDRLEAQAGRSPEATAVLFEDTEVSYRALHTEANRLARLLRTHGAGPGAVVAIELPRSVELFTALFAVLKTGAAYLALDPGHPPRRRLDMAAAADVVAVVAAGESAAAFAGHPGLVRLDDPATATRLAALPATALTNADRTTTLTRDHPAYVIHTSGSTGRPKGVVVPHGAVVNLLAWLQDHHGLRAEDRVLHKTPVGFDVSGWEFFWALAEGAAVVVARPDGHRDPEYLARLITARSVTTLHFVPPMLEAFLAEPAAAGCTSLRRVFCGGEALPASLARRAGDLLGAAIYNMYGPAEATIDVTFWRHDRDSTEPKVPIGLPLWNTRCHVLDDALRPVPVGVPGELYLAGAGLAQGYLNRPAGTAERFIADPHGPAGSRLYRTGDLVRRRADGALDFIGRTDHQVKIRGVRIEPGETAAVLREQPGVAEAVVTVHKGQSGARLVGYLVPRTGSRLDLDALLRQLTDRLPEHLVPAVLVPLERLPLTANGKVDRAALPEPATPRAADAYREPGTATERALHEVFAEVLGATGFGIDEGFFALGGDSISAARTAAIARRAGIPVGVKDVFQHQTIARIAAAVAAAEPELSAEAGTPVPIALPPLVHWLRASGLGVDEFVVSTTRELPPGADPGRLAEAIRIVTNRHDALGLVVDTGNRRLWRAHLLPSGHRVLSVPATATEAEAAHTAAAAAIDIGAGEVFRVTLLTGRPHRLLLLAHGLAADPASLELLADELVILLQDGPRAELPSAGSFQGWTEHLTELAAQQAAALELWRTAILETTGAIPAAARTGRTGGAITRHTVTLARPAEEEQLVAGFLTALRRWGAVPAGTPQLVDRMADPRRLAKQPTGDLSATAGPLSVVYPLAFDERGADLDGWDERGLGYPTVRHTGRAGKALADAPSGQVLLRAASPDSAPYPGWPVEAAYTPGPGIWVLRLTGDESVDPGRLRELLDLWHEAVTTTTASEQQS